MQRLKLMWHILRGRPLIYRVHFIEGLRLAGDQNNIWIVNNTFGPIEYSSYHWNPYPNLVTPIT